MGFIQGLFKQFLLFLHRGFINMAKRILVFFFFLYLLFFDLNDHLIWLLAFNNRRFYFFLFGFLFFRNYRRNDFLFYLNYRLYLFFLYFNNRFNLFFFDGYFNNLFFRFNLGFLNWLNWFFFFLLRFFYFFHHRFLHTTQSFATGFGPEHNNNE